MNIHASTFPLFSFLCDGFFQYVIFVLRLTARHFNAFILESYVLKRCLVQSHNVWIIQSSEEETERDRILLPRLLRFTI